eukprot:1973994-Pleurochrysis_carterae.AAC.1
MRACLRRVGLCGVDPGCSRKALERRRVLRPCRSSRFLHRSTVVTWQTALMTLTRMHTSSEGRKG